MKSDMKGKLAARKKHQKGTGGGAAIEELPPVLDKLSRLIEPVLITGDDDVLETGLRNQVNK